MEVARCGSSAVFAQLGNREMCAEWCRRGHRWVGIERDSTATEFYLWWLHVTVNKRRPARAPMV